VSIATDKELEFFYLMPRDISFYVCDCFFFQGKGGLRLRNVTGVQTCALPISERSPADYWSPHWQISMQPNTEQHWDIYEAHTARRLHGIGSNTIFDQISILLALTGLLREGINLAPIDAGLVRARIPSHPSWR